MPVRIGQVRPWYYSERFGMMRKRWRYGVNQRHPWRVRGLFVVGERAVRRAFRTR